MSELVNPDVIEQLVGITRHPTLHYGRLNSESGVFYILHSQECRDSGIDLRDCPFSIALDAGVDIGYEGAPWNDYRDKPVPLAIWPGRLIPKIDSPTPSTSTPPYPTQRKRLHCGNCDGVLPDGCTCMKGDLR